MSSEPSRQGLFAFRNEDFFYHFQEQPDRDHVMWFEEVGLPSHGPAYDAILRGRVAYDPDTDRITIGCYGAAYLSNRRYRLVVEAFGLDENRVVEKRLSEAF